MAIAIEAGLGGGADGGGGQLVAVVLHFRWLAAGGRLCVQY